MLPVAADVERERWDRVPLSLDVEPVGGGTISCGDRRAACRELLERYAVELAAEDIDISVHGLRLRAETDFVVVDLLRLWGATAQVIEAREVDALVDAT